LKLPPEPEHRINTVSPGCRAATCAATAPALSSEPQYTPLAPAASVIATVPLVVE